MPDSPLEEAHNFIHLIVGLAGLGVTLTVGSVYARIYAGVVGVVFVIVTIIGWVQGHTVLDLMSVNLGDNILSLVIAVTALAVFFFSTSVAIVGYTHRHNLAA